MAVTLLTAPVAGPGRSECRLGEGDAGHVPSVAAAGHDEGMGDAVRITSRSGRVRVIGEARSDVTADGVPVAGPGPREVRGRSKKLEVRVPVGTDLVVGTASGDVELEGEL